MQFIEYLYFIFNFTIKKQIDGNSIKTQETIMQKKDLLGIVLNYISLMFVCCDLLSIKNCTNIKLNYLTNHDQPKQPIYQNNWIIKS